MKTFQLLFSVVFLTVDCYGLVDQKEALDPLMKLLAMPIKPERYGYGNYLAFSEGYKVTSFRWSSCDTAAPIQASITLSPDPIKVSGNITVSVDATVGVDIAPKVTLKLTVKKKVLVWITIPCINNVGSCTYDDVCSFIKPGTACPDPLPKYNIPCHCPISKGKYVLPPTNFKMSSGVSVPSGDYKLTASLFHDGQQLACFNAEVSVDG